MKRAAEAPPSLPLAPPRSRKRPNTTKSHPPTNTVPANDPELFALEAESELAEAKPAMDAAAAAVDVLNAAAITELKGFSKPPNGVDKVMACVQMMYAGEMNKKKHTSITSTSM